MRRHYVKELKIKTDGKMYWAKHSQDVMFLIPKKRGTGFLRTPVGHHINKLSTFISGLGYDCDGLDGYLSVWTGLTVHLEEEIKTLVKELAEFLNVEAVEVTDDELLTWVVNRR
jgi:hypothetical protein